MRNRYPCRCIQCRKRIPANGGDYIGWIEGTRGQDGIRRGSGHFGICDECKVTETVEAPAVERQGLGDGATMSTAAPMIPQKGE